MTSTMPVESAEVATSALLGCGEVADAVVVTDRSAGTADSGGLVGCR